MCVTDFDGSTLWSNTWEGVSQGQEWQNVGSALQLNHPCGVSCCSVGGGRGRLAVADCYNNRVGVFLPPSLQPAGADADAEATDAANVTWSTCPLSHPTGVCWSRDNSCVAVADFDSGRVLWLRGGDLEVEAEATMGVGGGARCRPYDVECVGEEVWVVTDCVSSRVLLLQRDSRLKGGVAAVGSAAMIVSAPLSS